MPAEQFDFSKRLGSKRKLEFAKILLELSDRVGKKLSSRGWAYIMEGFRLINKNQFDKIEDAINDLRRQGLIPVDFTSESGSRGFKGVESKNEKSAERMIDDATYWVLHADDYWTPDWWENEKYYIQVVVEKVDLVAMFEDTCATYKVPIANAKGWSSILMRAEYARRFKEAEDRGLQCVLLYCGDHDPDGLLISDTMYKNLEQIKDITWEDGEEGYNPRNLIIDRFGLNFDLIESLGLTWIDNLITGNANGRMRLDDPNHPNHNLPYVQEYIKRVGVRKCEANAIVTKPRECATLMREAIEKYLGKGAPKRFERLELERKIEFVQALHGPAQEMMDAVVKFKQKRRYSFDEDEFDLDILNERLNQLIEEIRDEE